MNMMKARYRTPLRHLRQQISTCYNTNMTNTKLQKIFLFSIIFLSGFFVFKLNLVQAYAPPIGIPEPEFGIDESHMMYVGQRFDFDSDLLLEDGEEYKDAGNGPYTHYIDSTHISSTDTNNSYGTPLLPRKTVPAILVAGAVVEIHNNANANGWGEFGVGGIGTSEKPIFIRGINMPRIISHFDIGYYRNAQYIIVENFDFFEGSILGRQEGTVFNTSYISVRNCEINGDLNSGGIGISSWTTNSVNNIVIYNNIIHDNGDWQINYDQDVHGIQVSTQASYIWILNNEMYHNSGDGVQITFTAPVGSASTPHHIYIGRNISHHNKQSGMWTKTATDVIFSENTIYGHRPSDSSGGTGAGYQYDPQRVWFLFNTIYDNTYGISTASINKGGRTDIYMIGNIIHNNISAGIQFNDGDETVEVVNNTFYNNPKGIENGYYTSKINMTNNIISSSTTDILFPSGYNTADNSNVINSLFDNPATINWDGVIRDVTGMQSIGECTGCFEGNPLFIDASANNFNLLSLSLAINTGTSTSVYDKFYELYGLDISKDINGVNRPQGSAWDIGAYEYDESTPPDTTAPSSPTNLSVL
jgi:hypothetical protein